MSWRSGRRDGSPGTRDQGRPCVTPQHLNRNLSRTGASLFNSWEDSGQLSRDLKMRVRGRAFQARAGPWAAGLEAMRAARPAGSQAGRHHPWWVLSGPTGSQGGAAAGCDCAAGSDPSPFSIPRPKQHGDWAESHPKRPETRLQPAAADTRACCWPGCSCGSRALVVPGSGGAAGLLPGLWCRGEGLCHPRGPGGESETSSLADPCSGLACSFPFSHLNSDHRKG